MYADHGTHEQLHSEFKSDLISNACPRQVRYQRSGVVAGGAGLQRAPIDRTAHAAGQGCAAAPSSQTPTPEDRDPGTDRDRGAPSSILACAARYSTRSIAPGRPGTKRRAESHTVTRPIWDSRGPRGIDVSVVRRLGQNATDDRARRIVRARRSGNNRPDPHGKPRRWLSICG